MSSSEAAAGAPAISLRNVRFAYPRGELVLDVPTLQIPAGRRIFLYGPSGCGKTTLLSVISGILTPGAGEVVVLGQDLGRLSASKRDTLRGSQIGYIFQGFNLIPYLTVGENIALPCQLHAARRARMTAATLPGEVDRIVRRLDIHASLHSPVTRLSAGQQQRVAIARAIIGSPRLVIADEPTSSLDANRRDAFLSLLGEVTEETQSTLLMVSHDTGLSSRFDESISLPSLNRASAAHTDMLEEKTA